MKKLCNLALMAFATLTLSTCQSEKADRDQPKPAKGEAEYFNLRPGIERKFGFTQAVRIGNTIKISSAVSLDYQGNPASEGDMKSQLKNIYSDLEKTLQHFGCTFDDVVVENVYTTNMDMFVRNAEQRARYYKTKFPTGSWLEVKRLAMPEFLVEIELEAEKK